MNPSTSLSVSARRIVTGAAVTLVLMASVLVSSLPAAAQGYPAVPNESAPSVVTLTGVAVGNCPCTVVATLPDGSTRSIIVLTSGGSWSLDVPVQGGITTVTVDDVVVQEIVQAVVTPSPPTYSCPSGTSGIPVAGGTCVRPGTAESAPVIVSCLEPVNPATGECDNPVASCPTSFSGTPVIGGSCSRTLALPTLVPVAVTTNPDTVTCPAGTSPFASTPCVCVRTIAQTEASAPVTGAAIAVAVVPAQSGTTAVTPGVVVPAADYGFTSNTITSTTTTSTNTGAVATPTLALTGSSLTTDLGFVAMGLLGFGALALGGRRLQRTTY